MKQLILPFCFMLLVYCNLGYSNEIEKAEHWNSQVTAHTIAVREIQKLLQACKKSGCNKKSFKKLQIYIKGLQVQHTVLNEFYQAINYQSLKTENRGFAKLFKAFYRNNFPTLEYQIDNMMIELIDVEIAQTTSEKNKALEDRIYLNLFMKQ